MGDYEDMDSFLEGKPLETEQEVTQEEDPQQEAEEAAEQPTGEEEEAAPPVAEEETPKEEPKEKQVPVAALIAERKRAQALQRQIQEQQEKQPKPEIWDNPDEYIGQRLNEVEKRFQSRLLNMSEHSARSRYEDYDQKFQTFVQMVQRDPNIYQNMLNQPDPADYAYKMAKRFDDIRQMGDIDSYRSKVEAEVRAELEAKMKQEMEAKIQETNSLPESFAAKTSKSAPKKGQFTGPTSLNDILG